MTNRKLLIDFLRWYHKSIQEEGVDDENWLGEKIVDSYLHITHLLAVRDR